MRIPSTKLQNAIANMVANGGNMAKSLRDAGYSEAIARNPAKIFTLERMEAFRNTSVFNLDAAFRRLNQLVTARRLEHYCFVDCIKDDVEQLSDSDIVSMLEGCDYKVVKIVSSTKSRIAYYYANDSSAQFRAIEMIIRLFGLYPPRQKYLVLEQPLFSLAGLRNRVEKEGSEVTSEK